MVSKELEQSVTDWLSANIEQLTVANPISIHIDNLLKKKVNKSQVVGFSLQAFEELVKQLQILQGPAKPTLVIPLVERGKEIQMTPPVNLQMLEIQLTNEPPSLYLLSWDIAKTTAICEEFNTPLPFNLIPSNIDNVYVYYREYRYATALEKGWEVSRAVYVEYYPKGIITQ